MRCGRFALLALFVKCVKHTSVATETIDPFNIFDQQLGLNPNAQTFTPSTVVDTNTINNNDGNKSKRRRKKTRAQKKASREAASRTDGNLSKQIKIYSQNVHGIWESEKDEEGNPVKD